MKKIIVALLFSVLGFTSNAHAQAEPFIGQVIVVGFNFCPRGWAEANGQLISISQNSALFSLLGTTYGGDGRVTFGLPDLRGRAVIGDGQGPGLADRTQGEMSGTENQTLTAGNLPPHSHSLNAVTGVAGKTAPTGNLLAATGAYRAGGTGTQLSANSIGSTGSGQAFSNMQPYLVMNVCIATEGIYPSRP